jgi:hypothetical protein
MNLHLHRVLWLSDSRCHPVEPARSRPTSATLSSSGAERADKVAQALVEDYRPRGIANSGQYTKHCMNKMYYSEATRISGENLDLQYSH